MRIIAISDNHGEVATLKEILEKEKHDLAIHLGDSEMSESEIENYFDYYVAGNNDYYYQPSEIIFEVEGIKFGIFHGHMHSLWIFGDFVKKTTAWAAKNKVDVVIHGHTHIPHIDQNNGIYSICPGSISRPRSEHGKTYLLIDIKNGVIKNVEIKSL